MKTDEIQRVWCVGPVALVLVLFVSGCETQQQSRNNLSQSEAKRQAISIIEDANQKTFALFKKQPGGLELEVAQAAFGSQISRAQLELRKEELAEFYGSLPVVATVQIPTPSSSLLLAYDCVPRNLQPSLTNRALERRTESVELPPQDADESPSRTRAIAVPPPDASLSPTQDPAAYVIRSDNPACPTGTVPIKRHTLSEAVAASRSLQHINRYDSPEPLVRPGLDRNALRSTLGREMKAAPLAAFAVHRYAHALQRVENSGAGARLNVWSPRVLPDDMSLSQLWVVGGDPDSNSLQTVEAGWQVMSLWGTPFSALFIYSTSDNYGATGCYVSKCNLENPARQETFHIWTNEIIIGKPIVAQSVSGAEQGTLDLKWVRKPETGSWWLRVNGEWVGYYPASVFNGGPMARSADYIDFGGEATGIAPTSEMGSGRFPTEGQSRAAFQSRLRYVDATGVTRQAEVKGFVTNASCYGIMVNGPSAPEPEPGTYIYFGGPGIASFSISSGGSGNSACSGA